MQYDLKQFLNQIWNISIYCLTFNIVYSIYKKGVKNIMKVVIWAGGFSTRMSEESYLKPKPMIETGDNPILWHIMKIYSHYGFNEFIICLGYKRHIIKQFFADYYLYTSHVTFEIDKN